MYQYPSRVDYSEAVQQLPFDDPELRQSQVITNPQGLPLVSSGSSAMVFTLRNGSQTWAVRCFFRQLSTREKRYEAITQHLKKHQLDCLVDFKYLPKGIQVNENWYPIVKMEWVQGVGLDKYINNNLNNREKLQSLLKQWVDVCQTLREAEITHGDLQHGNILVTDQDQIKLIDYDGMILRTNLALPTGEMGLENYQHPTRQSDQGVQSHNFLAVDNFSAHIIASSIKLLLLDPKLWDGDDRDDNLIFRDTDYQNTHSPLFKRLQEHSDKTIQLLANELRTSVIKSSSYLEVPSLTEEPFLYNLYREPPIETPFNGSNWRQDHDIYYPYPGSVITPTKTTLAKPIWYRKYIPVILIFCILVIPVMISLMPFFEISDLLIEIPISITEAPSWITDYTSTPNATLTSVPTVATLNPLPNVILTSIPTVGIPISITEVTPTGWITDYTSTPNATLTSTLTVTVLSPTLDPRNKTVISNDQWTEGDIQETSIMDEKGVKMVWVPGGCFEMGGDPEGYDWGKEGMVGSNGEQCVEGFYLDQYEVTNADYIAFLSEVGRNEGRDNIEYIDLEDSDRRINGGDTTWTIESGYEEHPVVEVTWYGARDYCEWRGGTLPQEVEWEYASRGPSGKLYPWGDELDISKSVSNVASTEQVGSIEVGRSWVGAYDLSGNIWEWMLTDYVEYPYDTKSTIYPINDTYVVRGGSWRKDNIILLRGASRNATSPNNSSPYGGFRCARSSGATTTLTTPLMVIDPREKTVISNEEWTEGDIQETSIRDEKGVKMVWVPGGCFEMGGDPSAYYENGKISNGEQCVEGFYIDQYEVTNEDYVAFLSEIGGNEGKDNIEYIDLEDSDRRIRGGGSTWRVESGYEEHPVVEVTWYGARDYCEWRGGTLPQEVEWEYASRGPSGKLFPWGNELGTAKAVWNVGGTAEVGSIEAGRSWVGAYDLSGNVWEWMLTDYVAYPYDTKSMIVNTNNMRLVRGGSWGDDYTSHLRSSSRDDPAPGNSSLYNGFRCARSSSATT